MGSGLRRFVLFTAVFTLAVWPFTHSRASVWMRLRGGGVRAAAERLERTGAHEVYSSDFEINGGRGVISVYGFAPGASWRAAASALGVQAGAGGAAAALPDDPGTYLVASGGAPGSGGFAVLTDAADGGGSAEWPFDDFSMPPGMTPGFTASDSCTGSVACMVYTDVEPDAAVSAVSGAARTAGWSVVSPSVPCSTCIFLGRGDEVLVISACRLASGAGTGVLVMRY